MCIDLASLKQRTLTYKKFAVAFSYPDEEFLKFFPEEKREETVSEYDELFRLKEIWPYATEYLVENEFQRAQYLADIMGFYRAFGLEPDKDRPDAFSSVLEFMHYLIFKQDYALVRNIEDAYEKAKLCLDAQVKFFNTYLYPAAKKFAKAIISQGQNGFYKGVASGLLSFLEEEKEVYKK